LLPSTLTSFTDDNCMFLLLCWLNVIALTFHRIFCSVVVIPCMFSVHSLHQVDCFQS